MLVALKTHPVSIEHWLRVSLHLLSYWFVRMGLNKQHSDSLLLLEFVLVVDAGTRWTCHAVLVLVLWARTHFASDFTF